MAEPVVEKSFSTLRRFAQQASRQVETAQERCDFCSEPIPHGHRHLLEVLTGEIVCACRACSILFDRQSASQGKYRLVPDRRLALHDFQITESQWQSLCIPVGIAFFLYSTPANRTVVLYPSPMGPTESCLELSTWMRLQQSNPILNRMEPDVEALLVNRARGARQYFLAPIDECYRLVGLIRLHWKGLSGGPEVWKAIKQFFDGLEAGSTRLGE